VRRTIPSHLAIVVAVVGIAGVGGYYFGPALKSVRLPDLVFSILWLLLYLAVQVIGHRWLIPKAPPVHCPKCGEELPERYKGKDWHQRFYQWKDCAGCGLEVNMYGEPAKRYPQWRGGRRILGPEDESPEAPAQVRV
jgi:hypothetical protein